LKDTIVENDASEPTFKYVGDTASRILPETMAKMRLYRILDWT
jgi:hypothetical protein